MSGTRKNKSILDINKVYGSFFNMIGVFEATQSDTSQFSRAVGVSPSMVQLDAIMNRLCGFDPEQATYLRTGNDLFGSYSDELLDQADTQLKVWFSL